MRTIAGCAAALFLVFLGAALFSRMVTAQSGAPPIPHGISAQEKCLSCHNPGGTNAVPASHTTFGEGSCLSCHVPSASPAREESCLSCHSLRELTMTLDDGESISLYIDSNIFAASAHGQKLLCTDCHSAISTYPHPRADFRSRREYSIAQYELCKKCHFDNYTKTLDSIHYQMLAGGDLRAPLCTDCHGAHNVTPPAQPRAKISQTCAQCHQELSAQYAASVHGKALLEENNYDVPVCTDCHRSHTIEDPRTAAFRLESVGLCSSCHGNEKLMQKYGISTDVVKTYLQDFHGATVALISKQNQDIWPQAAVCTDCHGVHDIMPVNSPDSPLIKENLVKTCQKCHPDATTNFPSAWLSHYEPSITNSPLVFLVRRFYWVMIPFILVGLVAHVLVDLWRVISNR